MDFFPAAENFVYDDSEFYQDSVENFYMDPELYQDVEYYQDVEHFQFLGMTFGTILVILAVAFLAYKWINRKPGDMLSTFEAKYLKKAPVAGAAGGMYKPNRMYHNRQYDMGDLDLDHLL